MTNEQLEEEYALRGYRPADLYELAAVNEADPSFANEYPNSTHWKDDNGRWCFVTFIQNIDEHKLCVYRSFGDWGRDWWFAGVRK